MSDQPSELLRQIKETTPDNTFVKLLETRLYPVLDSLPSKTHKEVVRQLRVVLDEGQKLQKVLKKVDYEGHKNSLTKQLSALKSHCRRDYEDGYDEQFEMMERISKEVLKWLPLLWSIAIEQKLESDLVQRCLSLCTDVIKRVENVHSRAEFEDMRFSISIQNSEGEVIFDDDRYIMDILTWMWRELLVTAVDQGQKPEPILAEVNHFHLKNELVSSIHDGNEKHAEDSHNSHWTPGMVKYAMSLLTERHNARLTKFKENFSVNVFDQLVKHNPRLKAELLDLVRDKVLVEHPKSHHHSKYGGGASVEVLEASAEIFYKHSPKDLTRLTDATPSWSQSDSCKKLLVKHFAKQHSPEIRRKGLDIIEQALCSAMTEIYEEITDTFWGFDEACEDFADLIHEKKIPLAKPSSKNKNYAKISSLRDKVITRFVEQCVGEAQGAWDERERMMISRGSSGSDNSEDDEDVDESPPDLTRPILDWLEVLWDWPNREEATQIWDRVKHTNDQTHAADLLFAFDGFAEALADRCSWDYNHSSAKSHVSEAIRAMYKIYTCQDLAALKKYVPDRQDYGGGVSIRSMPTFW